MCGGDINKYFSFFLYVVPKRLYQCIISSYLFLHVSWKSILYKKGSIFFQTYFLKKWNEKFDITKFILAHSKCNFRYILVEMTVQRLSKTFQATQRESKFDILLASQPARPGNHFSNGIFRFVPFLAIFQFRSKGFNFTW